MKETRFKISAYGVTRREGHILLVRYVDPQSGQKWWTLPGGKLEHGEDPVSALLREVREETGYHASVTTLLGVGSRLNEVDWGIPGGADLHAVAVYYTFAVVGGELRSEADGSTDQARWLPEEDLADLDRAVVVDIALDLERRRPEDGHPTPVDVVGRLRH